MKYRVKVTELHVDYVWVDADSKEEAEAKAHELSECEYYNLLECRVDMSNDE